MPLTILYYAIHVYCIYCMELDWSSMAATGHALKKLAIFLIFVFVLKSFHLPDSDNKGQTILRSKVILLFFMLVKWHLLLAIKYLSQTPQRSLLKLHVRWRRSKEPRNWELYSNTWSYMKHLLQSWICLLTCRNISQLHLWEMWMCLKTSRQRPSFWTVECKLFNQDQVWRGQNAQDNRKSLDIMVIITEKFFSSKTPEEVCNIPGFHLLRKDHQTGRGGGVTVYKNTELNIKHRTDLEEPDLEVLWLEVCPFKSKRSLLMAGVYHPLSVKLPPITTINLPKIMSTLIYWIWRQSWRENSIWIIIRKT